jgi:hypothetical protein
MPRMMATRRDRWHVWWRRLLKTYGGWTPNRRCWYDLADVAEGWGPMENWKLAMYVREVGNQADIFRVAAQDFNTAHMALNPTTNKDDDNWVRALLRPPDHAQRGGGAVKAAVGAASDG